MSPIDAPGSAAPLAVGLVRLGPPGRGRVVVRRPRLLARLGEADGARLLLVAAPAGFGKSTLLADWVAAADVQSAWVSLDAADNDPARFWGSLLAAVPRVGAHEIAHAAGPDALAAALLELPPARRTVLVLDDYHLIESPAIHSQVAHFIAHLPAGAQVAIASRADPPFPLGRLRAGGELLEIRAADLRFTETEAGAWLAGPLGLGLSAGDLALLSTRTEGWAAALQLAALTLRGRDDASDAVQRFGASHKFVFDYIVEEVLTGLDPDAHAFLLRTAIAERVSAPLAEALTGERDAQARLEAFELRGLLITALDDERRWFRYHALFAEILRTRLRAAEPALEAELHARAAAWFEDEGDVDEALRHALLAPGFTAARRLVREHWLARLKRGEIVTVRRWLDALPDGLVRGDLQLSAGSAWALLLGGDYALVPPRIADIEAGLPSSDDPFDRAVLPSQIQAMRAKLAEVDGDLERSLVHARAALGLVPDGIDPGYAGLMRGQALLQLATVLRKLEDHTGAADAYAHAIPLFAAGGNWLAVARCVVNVARYELAAGKGSTALARCRTALDEIPAGSPATAALLVALGEALAATGDRAGGLARVTEAVDLARRSGDRPTMADASDALARLDPAPSAEGRLVEPLTRREREILGLVCAGRSNAEIAAELFITVGTAKRHIHAIYGKLGVGNRVEAVLRARELGLDG